jgi:4-amino-4-deoxy-L-arabinose transferase-like glycosyltransferase
MKKQRLFRVLLLALILRIGLLLVASGGTGVLTPDSQGYEALATSLAADGTFTRDGEAEIFRTPGYPLLIAVLRPFGGAAILVAQVFLDVVLVGLTYLLGRTLAGEGIGLLAALLQAISPLAIAGSCRFLSDCLYALLLTAALLMLIKSFDRRSVWSAIPPALLLAMACYVRPIGLAMAAVVVVAMLFRRGQRLRAPIFAGVILLCVAPWVVRNVCVADYAGFSSVTTDSLYRFGAAELVARESGWSIDEARMHLDWEAYRFDAATPGDAADFRRQQAVEIIAEQPFTYAGLHLRQSAAALLPGATDAMEVAGVTTGQKGTLKVLHEEGLWAAVRFYFADRPAAAIFAVPMVLILLVRYVGVIAAGIGAIRNKMTAVGWMLTVMVLVALLAGGPASTPRFRLPVEPLLSIAAAMGLATMRRRRS